MSSEEQSQENKLYGDLIAHLNKWAFLGTRTYAAGTLRIGHIPHVAPEAYLHRILPPLDIEKISELEAKIGRALPPSFSRFLQRNNGIGCFRFLSIYGLRTSYKRIDIDAMMEQPYNIINDNTLTRPRTASQDLLFVGSIGDERDKVVIKPDGSCYIWDIKRQNLGLMAASNIFEFVLKETINAEKLFDSQGKRLDGSDDLFA